VGGGGAPAPCNTIETLLVLGIARKVCRELGRIFQSEERWEMHGDYATPNRSPGIKTATCPHSYYYTEWLAPVVSIRVVKGLD